jgi:hypothetical protein
MSQVVDQVVPEVSAPMSLVQSLCATLKEMRKGRFMIMPIKKISNINVEVTIHKQTRNTYILNIGPIDFTVDDDSLYEVIYDRMGEERTCELTEDEFIEYIVQKTLLALKSIKIDKLNGKFTTTTPTPQDMKTNAMWTAFCQEFKDDEHMGLSMNECCVCFTLTKTTTNCEHAVCLECISKLRTEAVNDEQSNIKQKSCPLCRQRILFLN